MNRNEKNIQTRQKIINGALQEFSTKSYGESSLNTICATGNLSKGIIYHYFKDKDELYLVCVKECFDALTDHLQNAVIWSDLSVESALQTYFDGRIAFFESHKLYLKLFCSTVMNPPAHLRIAINHITEAFDMLNISVLTKLLENVTLRPDVSIHDVVEVFQEYQNFVNARFQMQASEEITLKDHEERCRRSLNILLYGVIERENNV